MMVNIKRQEEPCGRPPSPDYQPDEEKVSLTTKLLGKLSTAGEKKVNFKKGIYYRKFLSWMFNHFYFRFSCAIVECGRKTPHSLEPLDGHPLATPLPYILCRFQDQKECLASKCRSLT